MNAEFEQNGYLICRNVVGRNEVNAWMALYGFLTLGGRKVEYNPVAVNEPHLEPLLAIIAAYPAILDCVQSVFGPDIALYNKRFVVKDQHSRGEVFLHQDTPYHVGNMRKLSAFVALSPMNESNGGMFLYRTSHQFGYLGDAGELDSTVLPPECWFGSPILNPGDVLLMHSACWHGSSEHIAGPDRILADIIYAPADDPGCDELMRGKWLPRVRLTADMREKMFKRSRSSRLAGLQAENEKLRNNK